MSEYVQERWTIIGEDEEAPGWAGIDIHAPLAENGTTSVCFVKGDAYGDYIGAKVTDGTRQRAALIAAAPQMRAALDFTLGYIAGQMAIEECRDGAPAAHWSSLLDEVNAALLAARDQTP